MIKILDNILTKEECLELIDLAEDKFTPSKVLGNQIEGYRTAQNTWIYDQTVLTNKIKDIIVKETNLPIENQENIHIVKYEIEGEYKDHHDFFHPGEDYYDRVIERGGQRVYSCLIYLNDDFTGGETYFPNKNITITPKLGRVVIWRNLKKDNLLDYDSLHAGLPVKSGKKYISVIWIRENNYKK